MTSRITSTLALCAVSIVCLAPAPVDESKPEKDGADDVKLIQGTWTVVELQQVNHESSDQEKEFYKNGGYKITITEVVMIHSPDRSAMIYRLDAMKLPKILEFLKDGRVIARGIYELKGDDLKFCLGRKPMHGEEAEPPTGFDIKKAAPGTFPTLFVLKRDSTEPPIVK